MELLIEMCPYCNGSDTTFAAFETEDGQTLDFSIHQGNIEVKLRGKHDEDFYIPIARCPSCGRNLTEGKQ